MIQDLQDFITLLKRVLQNPFCGHYIIIIRQCHQLLDIALATIELGLLLAGEVSTH